MLCDTTTIASGDSLDISVDLGETTLLLGPPDTVAWQVFDHATGLAVSSVQYADNPAKITTFVVDGDDLTNTTVPRRRLQVQIVALFGDERKTLSVDVFVKRVFAMTVGSVPEADSQLVGIPFVTTGQSLAVNGIGL